MSKTIILSAEEQSIQQKSKQNRMQIFRCSLCVFIVGIVAIFAKGHKLNTIPESIYTVELLMLIFGIYFTFFVKEKLPVYYDENKISQYSHGAFRMNIPGIVFNNSNWHHIINVAQLTIMSIFALFPFVWILIVSLSPLLWKRGELFFTLGTVLVMFLPIYIYICP